MGRHRLVAESRSARQHMLHKAGGVGSPKTRQVDTASSEAVIKEPVGKAQ
jgi:hypothetical protein